MFEEFFEGVAAVVGAEGDGAGGVGGGAELGGGALEDGDAAFASEIAGGGGYNCASGHLELSVRGNVLSGDDGGHRGETQTPL